MKRETSSVRSSLRSRGSFNSNTSFTSTTAPSTITSDPRQKLQDCCRKLVAFMCTQVGVGGLIVGYAIVGAFAFSYIEGKNKEVSELEAVNKKRNECALLLWELTTAENTFNASAWTIRADLVIQKFQKSVADAVKKGYDTSNVDDRWSFSAALMFSLSVFTMLGYGNLVPRTSWGKLVTVIYAVFGIPLYALYFMNMGKVLAQVFRWVYTRVYMYGVKDRQKRDLEFGQSSPRIVVPSTACLWVMVAYIACGSFMFSTWESWTYLDSTYFCVTSLFKIGFGDFVPGVNILEAKRGNQTKLVINFVYILLGMGLMAMCYNLMRELVLVKMRKFKENIGICFEVIRLRAVACYQRQTSLDSISLYSTNLHYGSSKFDK